MADFDPKSRTERKEYDSVKDLTNQNIKEIDEADQRRERERTRRTGEGGNQSPPASDINRN